MRRGYEELEEMNRRVQERPRRLFLLVLLAGVAFLLGNKYVWGVNPQTAPEESGIAPADVVSVDDQEQVTFEIPRDTEQQVTDHGSWGNAPKAARQSGGRTSFVQVYECNVDGQRVVSDQPCGDGAQPRILEVDQPDPYEAARVQSQRQQTSQYRSPAGSPSLTRTTPATSGTASATAGPVNAAACEAVDSAIENLNARMRHPYGSAEGERLRKQWHDLKRQRYDLGCGR